MQTKKQIIFSLIANMIITILVIVGMSLRFAIGDQDKPLKYFTNLSNIFMGLMALIFVILDILLLSSKIKSIPRPFYVIKLIATSCIFMTFAIVAFIFVPSIAAGATKETTIVDLYASYCSLNHLVTPILSIVTWLLFDNTKKIKFVDNVYSIIPMLIYAIFYLAIAYSNIDLISNVPYPDYDWYSFVKIFGYWSILLMFVLVGITFGLNCLFWFGNKKINIFKSNKQ